VFTVSAFAQGPSFVFTDLIPSGSIYTVAQGVNSTGTVVGYYQTTGGGSYLPFYGSTLPPAAPNALVWGTGPCTPTGIDPVVPTIGISDSGAIVGGVIGSNCGPTSGVNGVGGFYTTNNGATFQIFNTPFTGTLGSVAAGINSSGEIAGEYLTGSALKGYIATDFSIQADYTSLADGTSSATLPAGINNSGLVVGSYGKGGGISAGFLWSGGIFYDVLVPGATSTFATGIDTAGDIVGYYQDTNGVDHGFIWTGYTLGSSSITGGTLTFPIDDPSCLDAPSVPCNNGGNSEGTQIRGISPDGKEIAGKYVDSSGTTGFYALVTPTVTLTAPANSAFGQTVALMAVIQPSGYTGTITFTDNNTTLDGPVTLSGGAAKLNYSALSVGSHTIKATYTPTTGSGFPTGPASNSVTITVAQNGTTTTVTSGLNPSTFGQPVTFTATVAPASGTPPVNPSGSVTFSDGSTTLGTASLTSMGTFSQAQFSTSSLTAGAHTIQATYNGDANFTGSSGSVAQTVNPAGGLQLASSANPVSYGQSVTFTATVPSGTTGVINFSLDGGANFPVPIANNQATYTPFNLSAGSHSVTATYSGTQTFTPSTITITETVNKAATTTALTSSVQNAAVGQPVTFTATVTPSSSGITPPGGQVAFTIDGGSPTYVALANGQAQLTVSNLTSGSHAVQASYTGDANYSASSGTFTERVGVTTITLTSSANPATYGTVVTFTATVPSGATGTVTFTIDGIPHPAVPLTGTQAQFAVSNLSIGSHSITAAYSGNASFPAAVSSVLNEVINQGLGNVGISASPSPSTQGQTVTFLATVPVGATGTITFSIDGVTVSTQTVASAQASFSTSTLSQGNHTITAVYSGDTNFGGGSNSIAQTVSPPLPALVTLTSSQNPSVAGEPVTFTAAVSSAIIGLVGSSLNGIPVAFSDGTTPLGIATVQNGQAVFTTSALLAGSHAIVAQIPTTALQLTIGQVVVGRPTTTTITAAPSPAVSGQAIVLTAQVVPAPVAAPGGIPSPTGTVAFQDNGVSMGVVNLTANSATYTMNNLGDGAHQFTAIYSGDKFWGSSYGRVSDQISPPPMTLTSAAAPLSSGFASDETVSIFNISGLSGDTTSTLPLGTSLGGVSVTITDSTGASKQALIYGVYASAGQINLVLPSGLAAGQAKVTITLPGGNTASANITVASTAPAIYSAAMNGKGTFAGQIVYVHPDGSQTLVSSASPVTFNSGDQVFLSLYGTGIRHYSSGVTATVNNVSVPALAVAQPDYPGLDQINLGPLPASLAGAGTVNIVITVDGQAANPVTVTIQ